MGMDWRVAVAAVDAALDRHEAALMEGKADELPRLSRELQAAIVALSRSEFPGDAARADLEDLSQRAQAQQGVAARRSAQVEASLAALEGSHPGIARQRARQTYGASGY